LTALAWHGVQDMVSPTISSRRVSPICGIHLFPEICKYSIPLISVINVASPDGP
jgi:hypothetical protein